MKELFDEGKMTIVQNVGYPNQDLSHFRSTDIWLSASDTEVIDESGWIGRYLEHRYTDYPDTIPDAPYSIEFATTLSRLNMGKEKNIGFGYIGKTPIPDIHYKALLQDSSEPEQQVVIQNMKVAKKYLATLNAAMDSVPENLLKYPLYDADFEFNSMAENLAMVARLIASGISTSIYSITSDLRFDTHDYHLVYHNSALNAVAGAVSTFQRELELRGVEDKVILLIYSEFGRRVHPNGSGLDHGSAAPVFIVGSQASGLVIGDNPNLSDLDDFANLKHHVDFRQIYASLLEQWFGERVSTLNPYVFPRGFKTLPIIKGFDSSQVLGDTVTMSLFPNPCTDYVVVKTNAVAVQAVTITTMNAKVFTPEYSFDGLSYIMVPVQNLAVGEYILNIKTTSRQYNLKFIKV
ncbi:MAG: DUF1501 domain-containing protein [Candidatus Kapabacteria bacterium]|nr:DUF1501 domain-containing protein [Candidatus Kapabacteria bacterium]